MFIKIGKTKRCAGLKPNAHISHNGNVSGFWDISQPYNRYRSKSHGRLQDTVLFHSSQNVMKDPSSERRINTTTDEHYTSAPYFDYNQATTFKAAIVDVNLGKYKSNTTDYLNMTVEGIMKTVESVAG